MERSSLSKFVLGPIQGDLFQYILIEKGYRYSSSCYSAFSYKFPILSPWRVFYIIQFPFDNLDPTLVDYLSHYLSACPIRHPFWPSMSWDSQCNTIQGSSPLKCGQKVSCYAFNAVAAALSQIFPSSHSSSMFVTHAPSSGVSWKVTLSDRICIRFVLGLFEEIFLLGPPFPTFPLVCYLGDSKLNTLTTVYSSSDQSTSSAKTQDPIYNFGPLSLQYSLMIIFSIRKRLPTQERKVGSTSL